MRKSLLELAEEPARSVPGTELIALDGCLVAIRGQKCSVERIRLGDVGRAVAEVRELAASRGLRKVTWWIGECSTPAGLRARLARFGLVPDDEMPVADTLTIASRPAGDPGVHVRHVETAEDYIIAREISSTIWPPEGEPTWQEEWAMLEQSETSRHYLALVDNEAVGFGRAIFTRQAALLMGGAVLPKARGRGAYTALVLARWEDTVARGVPRLLVGAGRMSGPILQRLGFEQIGEIHLLVDRL